LNMRSQELLVQAGLNSVLPISASQVARITDVSYQCPGPQPGTALPLTADCSHLHRTNFSYHRSVLPAFEIHINGIL
jgi:hypothetical protein